MDQNYNTRIQQPSLQQQRLERRTSSTSFPSCPSLENGTPTDWIVETPELLPPYHHLERSSIRIKNVPSRVISKRISDYLRVNSIGAIYHKYSVCCLTPCMMKFVVRLWRDQENPNHVIVELQRRKGCAIIIQGIRRGLFAAALDIDMNSSTNNNNNNNHNRSRFIRDFASRIMNNGRRVHSDTNSPPHQPSRPSAHSLHREANTRFERPPWRQERMKPDSNDIDLKQGSFWVALQRAMTLINSQQECCHKLGLQSLAVLTDSSTTTTTQLREARQFAESLVNCKEKSFEHTRRLFAGYFRDIELKNVAMPNTNDDCSENDSDEPPDLQYCRGECFGELHNVALQVLENVLKLVLMEDDNKCNCNVDTNSFLFWKVVQALVYNIQVAEHRPQEAAQSAKCLSLLLKVAPTLKYSPIITKRLVPALIRANEVGRVHLVSLEMETQSLMDELSRQDNSSNENDEDDDYDSSSDD